MNKQSKLEIYYEKKWMNFCNLNPIIKEKANNEQYLEIKFIYIRHLKNYQISDYTSIKIEIFKILGLKYIFNNIDFKNTLSLI